MPCEFSLYASADQYSVEYKGRCLQNVGVLCLCASLSYVLWTPSSLVYHGYQFCLLMGEWCWALPGFSLSEPCPLHSFKTVNWKDYGAHLIYVLSFAVLVFLAVITNKYRFRDLKQHLFSHSSVDPAGVTQLVLCPQSQGWMKVPEELHSFQRL